MSLQMTMFGPKSEWVPPAELPDIFDAKQIAIDVETRDPNLKQNGPGWPTGDGEVVGYDIAVADCCLLYTSPSPRDGLLSRMPSSA